MIAYCRTVLQSNVRGRLTDHVAVPEYQATSTTRLNPAAVSEVHHAVTAAPPPA